MTAEKDKERGKAHSGIFFWGGGGCGRGAESYDNKKAWSSILYSLCLTKGAADLGENYPHKANVKNSSYQGVQSGIGGSCRIGGCGIGSGGSSGVGLWRCRGRSGGIGPANDQ
jgi:hypothetical protein